MIRDGGSTYLASAGIEVDVMTDFMTISGNTIENNSTGGVVVSGAGHMIANNTLRNNGAALEGRAQIGFFYAGTPASDSTVTGNTMEADQGYNLIVSNTEASCSGHTINNNTYRYIGGEPSEYFYWPCSSLQWMDFETWQILTGHDADSTFEGPNLLPNIPLNLSPADGATGISNTITLEWIGGDPDVGDSVSYDVYLEAENPTPGDLICDDIYSTSCAPAEDLASGTTYYWMVVAKDNHGETTSSPTWSFTIDPCNSNGTCEAGEDCNNCSSDCIGGGGGVSGCGNGICEPGVEDCLSCPADCAGKQNGRLSRQFCCGDGLGTNPVGCEDSRCVDRKYQCGELLQSYCCGDGVCEGTEDSYNCELDCGAPAF